MRRATIILAAACAAYLQAVLATSAEPLSLDSAVSSALKRHATLAGLRAQVESARRQEGAARMVRDPEFRLGYAEGSSSGDEPGADDDPWTEYEYGLRAFPPQPGVMRANRSAATARRRLAEAHLEAAEWLVAVEVRTLYSDILYLEESLALAERLVESCRIRHEATQARYAEGEATSLDLARANLDYMDALAECDEAGSLGAQNRGLLALLAGVPDSSSIQLLAGEARCGPDVASVDEERLVSIALEGRAEVTVAAWELEAAKAGLRAVRREKVPWLSHVQVSYQEESGAQEDETWRLQAAIGLPLFSAMGSNPEDVLAAEVTRWQEELVAIRELVAFEVAEAIQAWRVTRQRREQFVNESAPLINEMRTMLEEADAAIDLGPEARAEIEERVVAGERALLDVRRSCEMAWLRVVAAVGREPRIDANWLREPCLRSLTAPRSAFLSEH